MSQSLMKEAREYYNKVRAIYDSTNYYKSYKLNEYWANKNMDDMIQIINNSLTAVEAIHSVQKTWMFSVNTSEPIKERAVDWLLNNQKKNGYDIFKDNTLIQESLFSYSANNVTKEGRILTPDFLRTVSIAQEIMSHCQMPESKIHIIELGAGCGHLSRTLRLFLPNCSYVIIDLPETLCFSYMFLKLNFPDARTFYVTDADQLKENLIDTYDYVFIPTMFAESVIKNRFDIFINTASLGEMKNSVIQYWMDFIQNKLNVRYLFTLNRFLNTIIQGLYDWRLEENQCSVLYDANWKILKWELEPLFTRCPYVDTVIARYVEVVAERSFDTSIDETKNRSRQLLLDVLDEDWVRLESSIPPEMSYRDNILVKDMTMSGTLFKLWESIRLDANELNVALMLKYLETLLCRQEREFEETLYYEDLFDKLFISKDKKDLVEVSEVIEAKRKYRTPFPQPIPSFESFIRNRSKAQFLPYLIEEGYNGFNIVHYGGKSGIKIYGVSQTLGPIDWAGLDEYILKKYQEDSKMVTGYSLYEVKHLIDQLFCHSLQKEISDRDMRIGELQKEISDRDMRIGELQKGISDRDTRIGELQKEISDRDMRIGELQKGISDRDTRVEELQKEHDSRLLTRIAKSSLKVKHRFFK